MTAEIHSPTFFETTSACLSDLSEALGRERYRIIDIFGKLSLHAGSTELLRYTLRRWKGGREIPNLVDRNMALGCHSADYRAGSLLAQLPRLGNVFHHRTIPPFGASRTTMSAEFFPEMSDGPCPATHSVSITGRRLPPICHPAYLARGPPWYGIRNVPLRVMPSLRQLTGFIRAASHTGS